MSLIKSILRKPYQAVKKALNYFYVKRFFKRNKNDTLIWIYPHIGDMFYGLLYVSRFREEYNVRNIKLIGNKKYESMYRCFTGIDSFAMLPEKDVWRFAYSSCGYFTKKLIYEYIRNNKFYTNDFRFMEKLFDPKENEGCLNYTKRVVYRLQSESQFIKPNIPERYIEGFDYDKMIIISPYAKSIKSIDTDFFDILVRELLKKGYDVYTNVSGEEKEIYGTKRLDCNLFDLYNYARLAKGFIGLRSGVCDLIAMTNIPMYILFNDYSLGHFATLQEYREGIVEFYGTSYTEYLNRILMEF